MVSPFLLLAPLLVVLLFAILFALPALGQTGSGEATAPPEPALTVDREAGTVSVTGLSAAGEVLLVGLTQEGMGYFQRQVQVREVVLADAAGELVFTPETGLPEHSTWAVVDLATGGFATHASSVPEPAAAPARAPRAGAPGADGRRRAALARADQGLFLVRPGEGAWQRWVDPLEAAVESDPADPETILVDPLDLEPLGASPPPPDSLAAGDVALSLDPDRISITASRLDH